MRTIEIEDDVYLYLLSQAKEIGEDASSILRHLLGLKKDKIPVEPHNGLGEVFDFLVDPNYRILSNAVKKFLFILSWAYKKNLPQFDKITMIQGNRRKYFSKEKFDLEQSGSSVQPKQIPGSPYWVITNNDTPKKKVILYEVLTVLGYDETEIKKALDTF